MNHRKTQVAAAVGAALLIGGYRGPGAESSDRAAGHHVQLYGQVEPRR